MKIWFEDLRIKIVLGVCLALTPIVVRVVIEARSEWRLAEAANRKGDTPLAIDHYRRCARWYAPGLNALGLTYTREAHKKLWAIAQKAERAGHIPEALGAYRSLRGSIYAVRSFYTPHVEMLHRANERIAQLMARQKPAPVYADLSVGARHKLYLTQLQIDNRPSIGWAVLALIGFCVGVVAANRIFTRAIDAQWRWVRAEAWRWSWVFVLGLLLFSVGLRLA